MSKQFNPFGPVPEPQPEQPQADSTNVKQFIEDPRFRDSLPPAQAVLWQRLLAAVPAAPTWEDPNLLALVAELAASQRGADPQYMLGTFERLKHLPVLSDVWLSAFPPADRQRLDQAVGDARRTESRLRLEAEKQGEREKWAAEDRERAQEHEADLKGQARAAWAGTPESFEQVWNDTLRDRLLADETLGNMQAQVVRARRLF